jgi:hypothetical protein
MLDHGPARPGTPSRPHGMPARREHKNEVKWDQVPARSAALLRVFFALVVLSMAAVTIMIIHLLSAGRSANPG